MVCPKPELLSAWHDGEVPSPWNDAIQQHVQACPSCSARLERYSGFSACLGADVTTIVSNHAQAADRVFDRLQHNIRQTGVKPGLLNRQLVLPLPVAAAAALLVAFLGFALLSSGQRNNQLLMAVQQAEEAHQMASTNLGMESIIEYLSRQDSGVSITISLPPSTGFVRSGEPFIVREADFKPAGSGK